jgi:hypothetical protein
MTAKSRDLFPLEKLMLAHLCGSNRFDWGADLHDASNFIGVWTFGHRKWADAHYCVTWIALRSLEEMGYLTWTGESRALGRRGYHYGLWKPTEAGKVAACRDKHRTAERLQEEVKLKGIWFEDIKVPGLKPLKAKP